MKRHGRPLLTAAAVLACAALLRLPPTSADNAVYGRTSHADGDTGAQRSWSPTPMANDTTDTGACANCHIEHSSYSGTPEPNAGLGYPDLLFYLYDLSPSGVCYACHTGTIPAVETWPGKDTYTNSAHGSDGSVLWPGTNPPARAGGDVGYCLNCHNPHGRRVSDEDNVTGGPYGYVGTQPWRDYLVRQEENLCLTCHDASGPSNRDIAAMLALGVNASPTFRTHPIDQGLTNSTLSAHVAGETATPVNDGANTRHVECEDCHNPHWAKIGLSVRGDSRAGAVLRGTWGVIQASWPNAPAPGVDANNLPAAPTFIPWRINDTTPEYVLCFRCHSSFSTLPAFAAPDGVTDISQEINPTNLAHHAIAAKGKLQSANILDTVVFVNGWRRDSYVVCSDCHTYQASTRADGPHGSVNAWILDTHDTTAGGLTAEGMVLCFNCHNYQVYYNGDIAGASRVDHPAGNAQHRDNTLNAFGIWCMNCHGGGTAGGIHGTNFGPGQDNPGGTNLGEHFMNGAAIDGFTYDAGGSVNCWSNTAAEDGANPYNTGCTRGHGGTAQATNFNY